MADIADLLVIRQAYDLLNSSNAAWKEGHEKEATALYILMRRLQPDNQELIFWASAAPEQDKKRLNASWNELSARMEKSAGFRKTPITI